MCKVVLGIDPDSDKHGVAVYENGKLVALENLQLMSIMELIKRLVSDDDPCRDKIEVHIEDVCANNAVFIQRQRGQKPAVQQAMARTLGKCQQAQIELERVFEHYKIKVVKHKISKQWKKNKSVFESVTGWTGRSNEDTRSAAYFGWLGSRDKVVLYGNKDKIKELESE